MPNILNIAQPVIGQDSTSRVGPRPLQEQQNVGIHQTPDPNKVQGGHDRNVQTDRQNQQFSPNLDSNFEQFLQMVRNTRGLTEQYSDVFFSRMGNLVSSGLEEGFTAELIQYMSLMQMTEADVLSMLKGDQGETGKFAGPFFDALRRLMKEKGPQDLKLAIMDFLKKYDNLTSSRHVLKNILSNLENIANRMPQTAAQQLREIVGRLDRSPGQGEHYENLTLLKNTIMPFLGDYVGRTRDFGTVRDIITMLTLNLARYDAGTETAFLDSLRELLGFHQVGKLLTSASVEELVSQVSTESAATRLVDSLANVISSGARGDAGYQNKALFQNIVQSALLNESVYMPLTHVMIPAELAGKQFFSEVWIDPDSREGKGGSDESRAVKLLIKFDIKDLGYFELVLLVQDGKADMELSYPVALGEREKEIRDGISGIMEKNNMSFRNLILAKGAKNRTISEVFPKIYEGRDTINVTI